MKHTFDFLTKLKKNNNRDWFGEHKDEYTRSHEEMIAFADEVITKLKASDNIATASGKKGLKRIYRDTRFSNNKTPYKSGWSCGITRATTSLRGGYYFRIEPGNSVIAGGFWGPDSKDLKLIREQIAQDPEELRTILANKAFGSYFGQMEGEQVKTAPKGFSKEDPAIDLLRFKQFLLVKNFTDEEVMDPNFAEMIADGFKRMRPFHDYFSYILTHDLNGVPFL